LVEARRSHLAAADPRIGRQGVDTRPEAEDNLLAAENTHRAGVDNLQAAAGWADNYLT